MNKTPKKSDPLTIEEIKEASDIFFPLFNEIHSRMPKDSTTDDTLKIMESVAKLSHKRRSEKLLKEKSLSFGFNKKEDDNDA
mgnify:CR=1 FL=1